ncbi:hypothetical protein MTO96_049616 [Rhipicephalus appendiculatus]
MKLFCRNDYYKVLQGSDADCLWLDEVKIDSMVVHRRLRNLMTGSEPVATLHDVFVLFGVLLCNLNSEEGTNFNQEWFRNRVNDLVKLFPRVSEPPPVPLYSESQADALSALGKQWPHTAAHIVCTIVEGHFQGLMKRLQEYACAQWRIAEMIEPQPEQVSMSEPHAVQQAQETVQSGPPVVQQPQQVDASMDPIVQQPLDVAEFDIPVVQEATELAKAENPVAPQPLDSLEVVISEPPAVQEAQEDARSGPPVVREYVEVPTCNPPVDSQPRPVYSFMTTAVPRLTVYAFPSLIPDFDPNWIRLVTRGGDLDTAVPCLFGFIKLFCRAGYYKVLQGSDADCLWLDEVKIDGKVVRRHLRHLMTGSEPDATMDDFYVLFGVLLCNVNSEKGTNFNQQWFQNRVNDLVALFPDVSEPPPVPLYSESQAEALSALGQQWPNTAAHIVCIIVEGIFQGPMKTLQEYVCAQWRIAEMLGAEQRPLESTTSEPPVLQQPEESSRPSNQEPAVPNTPVAQEPRSYPAVDAPHEDVTSIATAKPQTWHVGRSMPTATATQQVFIFPPQGEFDPNWIRLLTRSIDPETAVPCLLGFIELVCGADFQKVLNGADKDGLVLEQVNSLSPWVKLSSAEVRQQLNDQMTDLEPAVTMDDFYVVLGILLCHLSCPRSSDLNREQWPQTRAAICSIILKGTFKGPMERLQQYVSESWSFAGMEHAQRILEFLIIRHPWVVDVIPELKSKDIFLQEFLEVFKNLGADGPYMKLLHLPEAAKALREPLALHAAAAYALAVVDDWSQYTGVPHDSAEEEVFLKVSRMVQLGLRAPPHGN